MCCLCPCCLEENRTFEIVFLNCLVARGWLTFSLRLDGSASKGCRVLTSDGIFVFSMQGSDLIDQSSELIHSSEVMKINSSGWSQERIFFMFDHQIVYCKKVTTQERFPTSNFSVYTLLLCCSTLRHRMFLACTFF